MSLMEAFLCPPKPSKRTRWGAIRKRASLTPEQVREARRMRGQSMTYKAIGEALGAPERTVWDVCNYKTRRTA